MPFDGAAAAENAQTQSIGAARRDLACPQRAARPGGKAQQHLRIVV
jgi:hypothetical protein